MNAGSECPPIPSCTRTSVELIPDTVNEQSSPYTCRGHQVTYKCDVTFGPSLEWASEPDICRDLPLSFTAFDAEGENRTSGPYQARLLFVARNPPFSNFSSILTFYPNASVDAITIICGDQLSSCSSTKAESTLTIAGKCMLRLRIAESGV